MSISDAFVNVACDKCGHEEPYELTAIACKGWDARNITETFLARRGWVVKGAQHFCDGCVEDEP
jgi:hypothetical protein